MSVTYVRFMKLWNKPIIFSIGWVLKMCLVSKYTVLQK